MLLLLLFLLEEPIDPSGVFKGALIVWRWYIRRKLTLQHYNLYQRVTDQNIIDS